MFKHFRYFMTRGQMIFIRGKYTNSMQNETIRESMRERTSEKGDGTNIKHAFQLQKIGYISSETRFVFILL